MNKAEIAAWFDTLAPTWDDDMVTDDSKLAFILDTAGVGRGVSVLDVACGTGVLFPYYLKRDVSHVTGVDISREMTRIARQKLRDPRVEVLCGDMETLAPHRLFDCCVIYNAFPHFPEPERLFAALSGWLRPAGRLTVAHGMSREALHRHHQGRAEAFSRELPDTAGLAAMMAPWFAVDVQVSDGEKYVVSGLLR